MREQYIITHSFSGIELFHTSCSSKAGQVKDGLKIRGLIIINISDKR